MVFIVTIQLSHYKRSQKEYVSEQAWLYSNKPLFIETGRGPDLP